MSPRRVCLLITRRLLSEELNLRTRAQISSTLPTKPFHRTDRGPFDRVRSPRHRHRSLARPDGEWSFFRNASDTFNHPSPRLFLNGSESISNHIRIELTQVKYTNRQRISILIRCNFESFSRRIEDSERQRRKANLQRISTDDGTANDFSPDEENVHSSICCNCESSSKRTTIKAAHHRKSDLPRASTDDGITSDCNPKDAKADSLIWMSFESFLKRTHWSDLQQAKHEAEIISLNGMESELAENSRNSEQVAEPTGLPKPIHKFESNWSHPK
jgi:hypothetical protein